MTNDIALGAIPIEQITLGMTVSYSQTITDSDIKMFAGLSGDHNPVHVNAEYAEASRFGKRIAHGLMSAGFFSALFGTRLPGPGCVYVSQSLNFKRPVYIDDTVVATVTVTGVDLKSNRVTFDTLCKVKGKVVISGAAEIYIPPAKP
ncbi:MAG: MaoC family dehydratase [Pseudomonas kermanshahensis]|jgi:3-hydroxybutyryl-CoA dehydratase|uniref:MaoC family dehydratase n=1 Tax=Pseudomonas kermanshahensis TaxID=2745482 RepID=UPI0020934F97|nr:MaoC family dehydratase [Pseudomonas kermanshahensis]USS57315.1 MaoC family dehydratase [Pseudomonas kermanshahensis]